MSDETPQVILETKCRCRQIITWDRKVKGTEIHRIMWEPLDPYADHTIKPNQFRTFRFTGRYDLQGEKPLPLFREV